MATDLISRYRVTWGTDKEGLLFDTLQQALCHIEVSWPYGDPDASVTITNVVY